MNENKFKLVNHKVKHEGESVFGAHHWYRYDWNPEPGVEPRYSFCVSTSDCNYKYLQVFNRGTGPAGDYVEIFIRDWDHVNEDGKVEWTYTVDLCPHSPKGHTIPSSAMDSYVKEIQFALQVAAEIERRFFNNLKEELAAADIAMPAEVQDEEG